MAAGSLIDEVGFAATATLYAATGLALMLATLGFTLLGEALRDAIDPKLRQSR